MLIKRVQDRYIYFDMGGSIFAFFLHHHHLLHLWLLIHHHNFLLLLCCNSSVSGLGLLSFRFRDM